MKKVIIIVSTIIFICGVNNAQSSIQVNIKDCRPEGNNSYLAEFKLFRNDTLIKTVEPKHDRKQILKKLKFGKYKIEYKTIFQKTEKVFFELINSKRFNIDLCLTYLDYYSDCNQPPFIDQLSNGESYSIQVLSQGCFHSSDEKIKIRRKDNKYYLTFRNQEKLLNSHDIESIKYFEIELNNMESSGYCTTTDTYIVRYKNQEIILSDGSCSWNGDYHLRMKLDLPKKLY